MTLILKSWVHKDKIITNKNIEHITSNFLTKNQKFYINTLKFENMFL